MVLFFLSFKLKTPRKVRSLKAEDAFNEQKNFLIDLHKTLSAKSIICVNKHLCSSQTINGIP